MIIPNIEEVHLTIKQAKNELEKLNNDLELYLNKKRINYLKTQPGALKYKEILSNTNVILDKFTHYLIKDEECDNKIYTLQDSINLYQQFIVAEMKRISKSSGSELIVFLRDELNLKWKEIAKIVNYSLRQCHNIYSKAKK